MNSSAGSGAKKPHAVCVPYPSQGHINAMISMAKLLNSRGFHITFVNTVFNHRRLLRSRGSHALDGIPSFRFETIPDGLPETDLGATQDVPTLCDSTMKNFLSPFRDLLRRMSQESIDSGDVPPVSCIVSDGVVSFTLDAAEELGVPNVQFWTFGASGTMGFCLYHQLVEKGLVPLKDERDLTNGYLDTRMDLTPFMKNMRLRDYPSFIRTTDPKDIMLNYFLYETDRAKRATAIVFNTFDDLEHDALQYLSTFFPPIYTVGPMQYLVSREVKKDSDLGRLGLSLWKEDTHCLDWLDTKPPNSVIYLNFGSIAVMTKKQFVEFAWGLAASGKSFLWVIRPDIVVGDSAVLPPEFEIETKDRGMLASWCPQEKVLLHPAIGAFLTHAGWNSMMESIAAGVPMICWPFFGDQPTNCKFSRVDWEIGMEISYDVKREEVEAVIREMMDGEKGKKMREKAEEWHRLAVDATTPPHGSSYCNFEKLINEVLLSQK